MAERSRRVPVRKPEKVPVVRGAGANFLGLVFLGLSVIAFFGIAVWSLAHSFGRESRRASAGAPSAASLPTASTQPAFGSAMAQAPFRLPFKVDVEIVPFDVFCKKALTRAKGDVSPLPTIDLPGILQTLYEKKYAALESAFVDCQRAYEEERITDWALNPPHQIFSNTDPRIDPLLTAWVGAYPDTVHAWLARARHRRALAAAARGGRWIKDIPAIRIKQMKYLMAMAQQDYTKSIELNPHNPFSYSGIMYASWMAGGQGAVRALFAKGIADNPGSYVLWRAMLWGVQPKWGGSLEEMDVVMSKAGADIVDQDNLRQLTAEYYEFKGDHASGLEKDETAAAAFYKRMMSYKDPVDQTLWQVSQYGTDLTQMVSSVKSLVSLRPFDLEALEANAKVAFLVGRYDEALSYAQVLVFLDSRKPESLRLRGEIYERMENFDAAIEDYKNSLIYEPESSFANMHVGHLLDAIKGRPEEGAPYLMQALLVDPQNPSVLYTLGLNEETRKDCNVLKTAFAYLNACRRGNVTCAPHSLQWAQTVGNKMKAQGLCR